MTTKEQVLDFIRNFQNEGTIKTFTEGCCYWFAYILVERFKEEEEVIPAIFYNQVLGHFATAIGGHLYDITGELEVSSDWHVWSRWLAEEPVYGQVVIRDCILKTNKN